MNERLLFYKMRQLFKPLLDLIFGDELPPSFKYKIVIKSLKCVFVLILIVVQSSGVKIFAREGFQVSAGALGGLGVVAPQNHYDNAYYELDYKYRLSYGGQVNIGYGFSNLFALVLSGGYQQFNQKYSGEFSPGLGAPPQMHEKNVKLSYANMGLLAKFTASFQDAYVYDTKAQYFAMGGFLLSRLIGADVNYTANGVAMPYPSKLIPYSAVGYPYSPVTDSRSLFSDWGLSFVVQLGADIFISEKFAISPAIYGQAAILDINNRNYRKHDNYKASRTLFGGLNVGVTYYISR